MYSGYNPCRHPDFLIRQHNAVTAEVECLGCSERIEVVVDPREGVNTLMVRHGLRERERRGITAPPQRAPERRQL